MKNTIKELLTQKRIFIFIVLLVFFIIFYLGWHFYRGYNLYEHLRVSNLGDFKKNIKVVRPEVDLSGSLIDLNVIKFKLPTEIDCKVKNFKNGKAECIMLTYDKFEIFLSFPKVRPTFLSTIKKYNQNIPNMITTFSFDKPIHRIDTDGFIKSLNVANEFDYFERWMMRLNSKNISFWNFILSSEYNENKYIFETYCREYLVFHFQFKMETKSINSIIGNYLLGSSLAKIYSKDGIIYQEIFVTYNSDENSPDSKMKTEEERFEVDLKEVEESKIKCLKVILNILSTYEFKLDDMNDENIIKSKIIDSINNKK